MKEMAGRLWTRKVQVAWENAFNTVAKVMLEGYETREVKEMKANDASVQDYDESDELLRLRSAVDGAMTAIMMILYSTRFLLSSSRRQALRLN